MITDNFDTLKTLIDEQNLRHSAEADQTKELITNNFNNLKTLIAEQNLGDKQVVENNTTSMKKAKRRS